MRTAIGRRMTESKSRAPHFYVSTEIEMGAIAAANEALNAGRSGDDRVTVTAWLVRAVARSLAAYPALNAVWNGEVLERVEAINVGVAIAVPDGLVAPALLRAARGQLTLRGLVCPAPLSERAPLLSSRNGAAASCGARHPTDNPVFRPTSRTSAARASNRLPAAAGPLWDAEPVSTAAAMTHWPDAARATALTRLPDRRPSIGGDRSRELEITLSDLRL